MKDSLANLQEWERVLEALKKIKRKGELHKHQADLIRMLKYKGNWRIREAALEAVLQITHPMSNLVSEILQIVMDDNLYYEARVMACNALNKFVDNYNNNSNGHRTLSRLAVAKQLTALNAVPQPPMLSHAVTKCLNNMAGFEEKNQNPAA